MINWKLEVADSRNNSTYLKNVESCVKPTMDYLCKRLNEIDPYSDNVCDLFKKIFDELPIMNFRRKSDYNKNYTGPDFYIQYNKYVSILFEDSANCIRRELILENLFKDDEKV